MGHNDLTQVETLFHAALELPAGERRAYVEQACNGDEALFSEVSTLLASVESSNGFMEHPALSAGWNVLLSTSKNSLLGKSLGVYKIISPLGQGGMGDVYLAEDTRLNRKVALKFLSMEFVGDNWAKRQLLKEAQSVAMLDHANICQVYGIEDHDEHSFIVMQYVKGTTLADLIHQRSLTVQEVLSLAKQIVSALSEAHAHGIIHRDIKPRNIMVTANQQVKMLDFGLAKTVQRMKGREVDDSMSNKLQAGLHIGTVPYMSPEQLREERLDYRSDVFSVGIVLYEMLCGKNPFARDNYADTISAIVSNDPAPFAGNGDLRKPAALHGIIRKCLEKKAEDRYQSATDLLIDLESVEVNGASVKPPRKFLDPRILHSRRPLRAALALAVLTLLAFVGYFIYLKVTTTKSLAVMPIENLTGEATLNYMGDGLTDTLTTKLTRASKLNVKPATILAGYKQKKVDLKAVAHDFGLDAILTATIIGNSERQFLQARLFGSDGDLLWEQQYPLDMANVFTVEAKVSQKVISTMESVSAEAELRLNEAVGTSNPEARRNCWLGQFSLKNRGDKKTLDDAIKYFNSAIALEPAYAEAHAGLADCYALMNVVAYGQADTADVMNKAVRAANDALTIDPRLAQARTSLANVYMKYYWDWQASEEQFKLAIKLDPNYAPAHYGYSRLLTIRGRFEEAVAEGRIARDLDPLSGSTILNYCRAVFFSGKFEESLQCYDKLVADYPNFAVGNYSRALVLFHLGRQDEAIAVYEKLYQENKRLGGGLLGLAYGLRGRKADAERVLNEMMPLTKENLPPQEIALIYVGLGDLDNALVWFEQCLKIHFDPFSFIRVDPMFAKLRAEPRFISLVKKYEAPFPHPPPVPVDAAP
jgi:serine/threonine protein kinase